MMKPERRPNLEFLELRSLLTGWHNAELPGDVDHSGLVAPLDALLVVNDLNQNGSRRVESAHGSLNKSPDVTGDGMLTPLDVLSVVNVLNEPARPLNFVFSISPEQDRNSNGHVLTDQISLTGQTTGADRLKIHIAELDANLNPIGENQETFEVEIQQDGSFGFDLPIYSGRNRISASVRDPRGNELLTTREVVHSDAVGEWNATLLNVVRDWTTKSNDPYQGRIVPSAPPMVARNLAMVHTAYFDALNAVLAEYESYLEVAHLLPEAITANSDGDFKQIAAESAATTAAFEVARELYAEPDERAVFEATRVETLEYLPDGPAKVSGIEFGRLVAAGMLSSRVEDGSDAPEQYSSRGIPGAWKRTAPDYLPPLLPQWVDLRSFVVEDVANFRPPPPPELSSDEYSVAVDEVMRIGGIDSIERTSDQTEIALYWADGGGTATPPGHWNRIADRISLIEQSSLLDRARTFALLNLSLADAAIASWDAKYGYDFWRPIDAIREASTDGNLQTTEDASWLPLLRNPPFPTYTSGHSTFSGAGAAVLTELFGESYSFTDTSDGRTGLSQRPLVSTISREFGSFWEAAEEAGMSRIFGGIHFSFDNTAGLSAGHAIGLHVVSTALERANS